MRAIMCFGVLVFFFCLVFVRGDPTLFFADRGGVFRLEEGSRRPVEIPNTRFLNGISLSVDYDAKEGRLYWTDYNIKFIRSAYVNGTDSRLFKELNHLAIPWSVVIDDVSRLVFYADGGNDVIAMVTMREGYLHTVLDRGLDNPSSLALDTSRGVVFYTDMGSRPRIASVNYDSSDHTVLVSSNLKTPSGIALDPSGGILYWCDNGLGRLESFDYRGSQGRQLLLYIEGARFYALDLFGDSLYFSAWNHSYIRRLPRDGGNISTVELDDPLSDQVLGLRVVDLNQTSSSPDPVGCECSHICVVGGGQSWRCLCPDGLSLSADSKTCTTDPNLDRFVLFGDKDLGRLFRMDLGTGSYVELPINATRPIGIDYDVIEGRVYWSDVRQNVIASARLDGSGFTVIRQLNSIATPDGLELDAKARLLFYSDTGNDIIGSININDSTHREVFTANLEEPRAVALDIEKRLVYYTDWGSQERIGRFTYEGQQHEVLVSSGLVLPNGLTLDRTEERLYWCDAGTDQIESVKTDGTDRRLLLQMLGSHFFGIDLYNGYLYYTDWQARNLSKIRTDGSGRGVVGPSDFLGLCDLHVVDNQQALQAIEGPRPTTAVASTTTTTAAVSSTTAAVSSTTTAASSTTTAVSITTTVVSSTPAAVSSTTADVSSTTATVSSTTAAVSSTTAAVSSTVSTSPSDRVLSGAADQTGGAPSVIGAVVGGSIVFVIVSVVLAVLIVCRMKTRSQNAGHAYYDRQSDSDYAQLNARGQLPLQGQVNVTVSSGDFAGDRDSTIYDTIKDYDTRRGAPPFYQYPVHSES